MDTFRPRRPLLFHPQLPFAQEFLLLSPRSTDRPGRSWLQHLLLKVKIIIIDPHERMAPSPNFALLSPLATTA